MSDVTSLRSFSPQSANDLNHTNADGSQEFWPFQRDPETLARPWAPPGLAGLEHRIGGLEKSDGKGNVAYDGANHERMTQLRGAKVAGIAASIPDLEVDDPSGDASVLVLGWGGTYGSIAAGVARVRARGKKVAHAQLRYLNPLPANVGDVLARYETVIVPELNMGQLSKVLRAEFLLDVKSLSKVQGVPFRASDIEAAVESYLGGAK